MLQVLNIFYSKFKKTVVDLTKTSKIRKLSHNGSGKNDVTMNKIKYKKIIVGQRLQPILSGTLIRGKVNERTSVLQ
jgi:hypothetical protein